MCGIGRDQLTIIENPFTRDELSESDIIKVSLREATLKLRDVKICWYSYRRNLTLYVEKNCR